MKINFSGIVLGLVLGAGATFAVLHFSAPPTKVEAAKTDAPADSAPEPGTVHLETDDQEKAGMKTAKPEPMEYKPETKGFARVLDPAPLAAELADITAAAGAADASAKDFARLQLLKASDNASARALETADAMRQHDEAQLTAARARLLADWGPTIAARADLPELAAKALAQKCALVRVDVPGGLALPPEPRTVKVAPIEGTSEPMTVEALGPAPKVDSQAQGTAFLALLDQPAPPVGAMLVALITGGEDSTKGFRLPGPAIVRYDGDTYVYAQTGNEDFERWRVKIGAELRDGSVFVTDGVTAQDHIVVVGAAQLLSEELKAATGGPD